MTDPFAEIVTLAEAAELLGVAPSTLRHQTRTGRLQGRLIGKTWITTRTEVERYARESRGRPGRRSANSLTLEEVKILTSGATARTRHEATPMESYGSLFPVDDGDGVLTPREAAILDVCLSILGDHAKADAEMHADEPVTLANHDQWLLFGRLPMSTWRMPGAWRRRFSQACFDLADDLETGRLPTPRCPGEEAALWLALDEAPSFAKDEKWPEIEALPLDKGRDGDWLRLYDELFQDGDIELVMKPGHLDGIEHPGEPMNQFLRMGDYRPAAWFDWVDNVEPRNERGSF